MEDNIWINNFAQDYIDSQSFKFSSFVDAKNTLSYKRGLVNKHILYDRLSLCLYEHNLSFEEYRQFYKVVNHLYAPTNYDKKCREEYVILFRYLWSKSELDAYSITKKEHPDFLLKSREYSIGIEITQLTTPYEKIMDKISSLTEESESVEELKRKAETLHGQKANDYCYYNCGNSIAVGTKTLRPDIIRKMFVTQIMKKYKAFETDMLSFDYFIILCDALDGITITKKEEVGHIADMLSQYAFTNSFCLSILWYDPQLKCSEILVKPTGN